MPTKKFQPIKHFEELFPSAARRVTKEKPFTTVTSFPRKTITQEYPSTPPKEPTPPKPLPPPPTPITPYRPEFKEITDQQAQAFIDTGQITGFDPISVRKLIIRSPRILYKGLRQKWYDLLLFPTRAGWSEFTPQERNIMPWLATALDWGISSTEMYDNAHHLPKGHPLKHLALTAAKNMTEWEQNHPHFSDLTAHSKPLDQLLGQPVLIGSDGWPLNQLDQNGLPLPEEDLYENTYLLYHRHRPKIGARLQKLFTKITQDALKNNRISLIQS
jgi:hypothetical protein